MSIFNICPIEVETNNGLSRIKAELGTETNRRSIYFRSHHTVLTPSPEAWVCLAFLPSMKLGASILLDEAVSPRLLAATNTLSDIFCTWYEDFQRPIVQQRAQAPKASPRGLGVATFFTGGMDSFYTLLKHRDEITHLIFVHGIDVGLKDTKLRQQVSEMLKRVGQEFGVSIIEIESNIRGFLEHYEIDWTVGHGPALACIGHMLTPHFRQVYIPSSHTYNDLFPWGSHPMTDPLWSSENLQFIHDGNEANRAQKAALLAKSDIALKSLRVCFFNVDSAYNCGRCEKCIRTMINLRAVDALERCQTFPKKLDLKQVKRLSITTINARAFLKENLDGLKHREADHALYEILLTLYQRPLWRSRLHAQYWRRIRVWKRSIRRRLGLEPKHQWPVLGGDDHEHEA